jgi:hypothetical protein
LSFKAYSDEIENISIMYNEYDKNNILFRLRKDQKEEEAKDLESKYGLLF